MAAPVPLLRPMSVGDLLDQAIRIYRRNFVVCVGAVAVISVPLLVLQLANLFFSPISNPFSIGRSTPSDLTPFLLYTGTALLLGILGAVGLILQIGALAVIVSESYLGKRVTIVSAYARVLRRALPLLLAIVALAILDATLLVVALIPFFGFAFVSSAAASNALALLLIPISCGAFLIALLLLALLNTFLIFAPQAITLENLGVIPGWQRSWNLVRGSFWRVLGILVILVLFIYVLTAVPTAGVYWAALLLAGSRETLLFASILQAVIGGIINLLITPIQYAVLTMLYYDLRVRKEGFDLELAARQLGQELVPPADQPAAP